MVEFRGRELLPEELDSLWKQVRQGLDLLGWYNDLAEKLPGGKGALIHEYPEFQNAIVLSDVSRRGFCPCGAIPSC